ncbi:hypothetical protein Pmar_PMAR014589 [Perkinsus marinus ATCC 50983]|uniref:Uncharacterized protein n=1 Tax=Perkinsus marinus (strain ATCC 50983 / TXsc) TaxID=423536 RepID=C5LIG8_PERM5|nr:hypothetical protein Pmar_PMAR014589 [Perkinsus marinus ATCC 50983]EER03371.1 hypothetical protein Pmar_PMAR014589 [Perkinsus marinus ATCC 50983]|eukprot:XP_002771555.1 hypothetical protein Pmar_PMAR014589 [Perkinsus marinus ATCC 50983]
MCGSCYNNENILDLPGLEFLIRAEVDGRVLYRATSDDIFERKFGAKLAAQVKRNRQSGLLTQLPTTSVSSTFMRLTDGGGSVHYPSVIVGVFVFDRGAWHFVRVGQTCQGTNMISMKADIASIPSKISKEKIDSPGLSVIALHGYSIFDANANGLGTTGSAQDADAVSGVKADSNGPPANRVSQDEYDALVTKFSALATAHNKLQTEYSTLEIEITHRDAKIEQLTKEYRAMESR